MGIYPDCYKTNYLTPITSGYGALPTIYTLNNQYLSVYTTDAAYVGEHQVT
jgi:hypothetical protein